MDKKAYFGVRRIAVFLEEYCSFRPPPKAHQPQTDKAFRIGTPMRKASWTKRFAAGRGSVGGRIGMAGTVRSVAGNVAAARVGNLSRCAQHF